ncbi:MAG TPA: hypothetical protein VFN38_07075, partial [Gemmatimonadaceae bacterium]|nr:hypothetical protein [Gemmatimonadaceae bacterium]
PLGHRAIGCRHRSDLRQHGARIVGLCTARASGLLLADVLAHRGAFLRREYARRFAGCSGALGGSLGGLVR